MSITIKNLVHLTREAILTHPLAINPPILNPLDNEQVFIKKVRHFDGLEVLDLSGLTLSIFPYYFKSGTNGGQTINTGNAPVVYKEKPLYTGTNIRGNNLYEAMATIVIKVHYPALALGNLIELEMDTTAQVNADDFTQPLFSSKKIIQLQTNPAEEIIQDWVENLRLILDDSEVKTLSKYGNPVTSSRISHFILNTLNWQGGTGGSDVYFHEGYLVWNLVYYPDTQWDIGFNKYIEDLYLHKQVCIL
jgi:hypothetical protein